MEQLMYWLSSYIYCTLSGGDIKRLLNMCHNQNIKLWDMHYENDKCVVGMSLNDFWKIRRILRKTKVKIHIIEKHGLAFTLFFLKKRKGLWIGFIIFVLTLSILSSRIWKVEISGNSYYTQERLIKYLQSQEKINYGTKKSMINTASVEENIRLAFNEISWISVRTEGTSLIIDIEEMVKYDSKKEFSDDYKNIYAKMDGVITYMVTRCGTPIATIGDEVKKGDLLIKGEIVYYDDSHTVYRTSTIPADGDVKAKVTVPYKRVYYFSKLSKKYGVSLHTWKLSVGNRVFELGEKPDELNIKYQHVSEIRKLLPGVYIQTDIFHPYEKISSLIIPDKIKLHAEKELSDICDEYFEKGVQILQNNVRIDMYEDRVEAIGDIVLIQSIGTSNNGAISHTEINENGEIYEYNRNYD